MTNNLHSNTQTQTQPQTHVWEDTVGGLPIQVEMHFLKQKVDRTYLVEKHIGGELPAKFVTSLVRQSYSKDSRFKQAVLDALSPFQISSKIWAASTYAYLTSLRDFSVVIYIGSWFGMQSVFDYLYSPYTLSIKLDEDYEKKTYPHKQKVYLDLDSEALYASSQALGDYFLVENSSWHCVDAMQEGSFVVDRDRKTLVVWTGLEHFDPVQIQQFVDRMPKHWTYLLQGTNMPAPDHINPVCCVEDLSKYFNTEPLVKGEMKTPLGSRFMIAV